jgi:hypothetical protein
MEGIGARIEADIGTNRGVSDQALIEARGHVMNQTSLSEVAEEL